MHPTNDSLTGLEVESDNKEIYKPNFETENEITGHTDFLLVSRVSGPLI